MTKVFVYGSLKRAYWNHRLLETATFLGEAVSMAADYFLFDVGFPLAVNRSRLPTTPLVPQKLFGELFSTEDPQVIERLDRLESNGRMYQRTLRLFENTADNSQQEAYIYEFIADFNGLDPLRPARGDDFLVWHPRD